MKIRSIEFTGQFEEMCDIEVEGVNSYCMYPSGNVSHNSKEPIWVNTFISGGDLHKEMAIQIYGRENYDRNKRKKVKCLNFGALYGGSKWTFSRQLRCSLEEAQDLLEAWWGKLRTLRKWTQDIAKIARKQGFLYSIFGRPRRLKHWYQSPKWKDRMFADRTAVNTQVQGAAGDMLRIDFVQIRKQLWKELQSKDLMMVSTIHDEINAYVRINKIHEIIKKLVKIMMIQVPGWKVPMEVGIEIGTSWGNLFKFEFDENGDLVPKKD